MLRSHAARLSRAVHSQANKKPFQCAINVGKNHFVSSLSAFLAYAKFLKQDKVCLAGSGEEFEEGASALVLLF